MVKKTDNRKVEERPLCKRRGGGHEYKEAEFAGKTEPWAKKKTEGPNIPY